MKEKRKNPVAKSILSFLSEIGEMIPQPFETPYAYIRRAGHVSPKRYYDTASRLRRRGAVEFVRRKDRRFLKLTRKGQLELLLTKAKIQKFERWDGKWRLIMFDIPQSARNSRDQLRYLIKGCGFRKLQASVFISPHPLNRSAIDFLKSSKLINYIRILRVEQIDDDSELKKLFKLV